MACKLTSDGVYAARAKLKALGFPDSLSPPQLDAARELVQRQRFVPIRRDRQQPVESELLQ